jgi:hypothetical protein
MRKYENNLFTHFRIFAFSHFLKNGNSIHILRDAKSKATPAASVISFAPLNLRRTATSTSELLRFL